jgi:3-hydroxyacyl-[acyl-carrier protein] dehydratase/trans-2-decenoyl-[acyl-carrier protein] isomerase
VRYAEFLNCCSLSQIDLLALAHGSLIEDPPAHGIAQLPAPPLLMFDQVNLVEKDLPRGRMIAEQRVRPDAWYFQCHFRSDPVQPGCLGVDALWQLLGLFCSLCGAVGTGRALGCGGVEFEGSIRPFDGVVRYELDVLRYTLLKGSGSGIAVGDGRVFVDGEPIYTLKSVRTGVFTEIAYRDFPSIHSTHARGGVMRRS